jgi:hydroxypyruvate reductase
MQLTLLELKETYRALVLGGAPIGEINTIRKHLSAFKGGRLALRAAARGAQQISLIISDVAGSDAGEVSSGPTLPDRSTVEDCYRIARQRGLRFPPPVQRVFDERSLAETPKPANPAFAKTSWHVLMDNDTACTVLAERARLLGLAPEIDHTSDEWEYKRAADFLVKRLQELRRQAPNACLISGGEVLVKVANGGTGGRNQQLALACAMRIAGSDVCVLSGGTDGIDGNSDGAGAVVDGTTVERLKKAGFNAQRQLEAFDAYPALRAIGDTLVTGLTGNNVRDLRLLL